jgi:hypothetical protein
MSMVTVAVTAEQLVQHLLEGQSDDGAFLSYVRFCDRTEPDRNGFVTALVLRALRQIPDDSRLDNARTRALDFIEGCECPERPGAFGFWPRNDRPTWATGVTEDADDTGVIALELFRHGRLNLSDIRRIVCKVLLPHRLRPAEGSSLPWIRPGVFSTWLHDGVHPNPIDCCVNANVVALMTAAGLGNLPGYNEACSMIKEGVRWAGQSRRRMCRLVPYYPDPRELFYAIRNAVELGAEALVETLGFLREYPWQTHSSAPSPETPIFGSSDGTVFWTSSVLAAARTLEEPGDSSFWRPTPQCRYQRDTIVVPPKA